MENLAQFFATLNDINFRYVVLRNWDGLPYDVKVGPHSDLDLLVYDKSHFLEVMGDRVTPTYPEPRVQYKLAIGDSYVLIDVRETSDGYYPYDFAHNILTHRVYNKLGFFTPEPTHHRIALAYHVVHHKGYLDPSYRKWLGDTKFEDLLKALKQSNIGWEEPDDPTVGTFNSYVKGATSVVSKGDGNITKKQYRFREHNLIANEVHVLQGAKSRHFPKVLSYTKDSIDIEDCGDPLTPERVPPNWYDQLVRILRDLKVNSIIHRDIRIENLMLKDGIIKLIDFGWAHKEGEDPITAPDLLGYPNKSPWGYDDGYSIGKVIKQITATLEEKYENIGA